VHERIDLFPLNRSGHSPIHLKKDGDYQICGWYIGRVPKIQRVEKMGYENVDEI
jgi:hypothetical protein